MIPSELIFISMPATTDFTGPLIGIGGVLIGSAIGFFGLRWQQSTQRGYDIRKLGAELIAAGEKICHGYLSKSRGGVDSDDRLFIDRANANHDEMVRLQRHLELIAPGNVFVAVEDFVLNSSQFHLYAYSHYGLDAHPSSDAVDMAFRLWQEARKKLITTLSPRHERARWSGLNRSRWELERTAEK